jgi:hypothetical protein
MMKWLPLHGSIDEGWRMDGMDDKEETKKDEMRWIQ